MQLLFGCCSDVVLHQGRCMHAQLSRVSVPPLPCVHLAHQLCPATCRTCEDAAKLLVCRLLLWWDLLPFGVCAVQQASGACSGRVCVQPRVAQVLQHPAEPCSGSLMVSKASYLTLAERRHGGAAQLSAL